jgi:hypothetical protein
MTAADPTETHDLAFALYAAHRGGDRAEARKDWPMLKEGQRQQWHRVAAAADTGPQRLALAAASQAGKAVAELIRFAREGGSHPGPFGDVEVIEKLCDALKLAIEVDCAGDFRDDDLRQLHGAACKFLDGWAG